MKKYNILLLIFLTVFIFVLSGCRNNHKTGENNKIVKEGKTDINSISEHKKELFYAREEEPLTLDPAYIHDFNSAVVSANIFEGLIRYKENSGDIEPCLAERWEVSDDGKEYTFYLRKNVKFHDGTDFNADAVVYNVERMIPPNVDENMPYASFVFGIVEKIAKVDDYTVKFYLKEPYGPFVFNLAISGGAASISSPTAIQKYGDNYGTNPVGTGPFKFEKWEKGKFLTISRNDDYWETKVKLEKVTYKFMPDISLRTNELINGTIDVADLSGNSSDLDKIDKITLNNKLIYRMDGFYVRYIGFNCAKQPFSDPKMREIVCRAINRQEWVNKIYKGYGEVANTMVPSSIVGYNDKVAPYEYDPDKARTMLKELGKENIEVNMIVANSRVDEAKWVRDYLNKIGIDVKITEYGKDYYDRVFEGKADMFVYGWLGDTADIDNYLFLFETKEIKSSLNSSKYSNKIVDDMLEKARRMTYGEERFKIYKKIQEILIKDIPMIPMIYPQTLIAYSPSVANFSVHPYGIIFFKNIDKN